MNKQMETSSFNPTISLVEEGKWLLGVTSSETTNSVFNITDENNSFSFNIPGHWNSEGGEELINELNEMLELKSENDIELHVKEVEKRDTGIQIENSGYKLAGFDHLKRETIFRIKKN